MRLSRQANLQLRKLSVTDDIYNWAAEAEAVVRYRESAFASHSLRSLAAKASASASPHGLYDPSGSRNQSSVMRKLNGQNFSASISQSFNHKQSFTVHGSFLLSQALLKGFLQVCHPVMLFASRTDASIKKRSAARCLEFLYEISRI